MTKNTIVSKDTTRQGVRERYGKLAEARQDCGCRPDCCAADDALLNQAAARASDLGYSEAERAALPDGADLGLGCGNPVAIAKLRPGETVLDLGSGAGFDCFIAARQVGDRGRVIGVDMTPEMISAARRNAESNGFANVEFRLGEIEALPVPDGVVDVILSNCVVNLSPDKPAVFREAFRVLKKGGRLSIADILATQPLPDEIREDFAAYTACLAGAALVDDVEAMLKDAGFSKVRISLNEKTRHMISKWSQSGVAGDYLVSAIVEAVA